LGLQVDWTDAFRNPFCGQQAAHIDSTFSTTFGSWPTDNTFVTGGSSFSGSLLGEAITASLDGGGTPRVGAAAGVDVNVSSGLQSLIVTPVVLEGGRVIVPLVVMRTADVAPGTFVVDDVAVQVLLLEFINDQTINLGRGYDGALTLTAASNEVGAPVTGSLQADLVQVGF